MKISSVKVDLNKIEQGEWVDNIPELTGVRLKVRGANNKDWRRLQQTMIAAVPRRKRVNGNISPDEIDRINAILLRDAGIVDWEGIEDDAGDPIPYSKEKSNEYLTDPEFVVFRDGALWACQVVGTAVDEDISDTAKN